MTYNNDGPIYSMLTGKPTVTLVPYWQCQGYSTEADCVDAGDLVSSCAQMVIPQFVNGVNTGFVGCQPPCDSTIPCPANTARWETVIGQTYPVWNGQQEYVIAGDPCLCYLVGDPATVCTGAPYFCYSGGTPYCPYYDPGEEAWMC